MESAKDWQSCKDQFLQAVYRFGAIYFDTEGSLHLPGATSLALLVTMDAKIVVIDLRKMCLPQELMDALATDELVKFGSAIAKDVMDTSWEVQNVVDTQHVVRVLKEVRPDLFHPCDKGCGLGHVMYSWYGLYYKPLTPKKLVKYGVSKKSIGQWRNLWTIYSWRSPISYWQRLYLRNDGYAAVNIVAVYLLHVAQVRGTKEKRLTPQFVQSSLEAVYSGTRRTREVRATRTPPPSKKRLADLHDDMAISK